MISDSVCEALDVATFSLPSTEFTLTFAQVRVTSFAGLGPAPRLIRMVTTNSSVDVSLDSMHVQF